MNEMSFRLVDGKFLPVNPATNEVYLPHEIDIIDNAILAEKKYKELTDFIDNSPVFAAATAEQQHSYRSQHIYLGHYLNTLVAHIKLF